MTKSPIPYIFVLATLFFGSSAQVVRAQESRVGLVVELADATEATAVEAGIRHAMETRGLFPIDSGSLAAARVMNSIPDDILSEAQSEQLRQLMQLDYLFVLRARDGDDALFISLTIYRQGGAERQFAGTTHENIGADVHTLLLSMLASRAHTAPTSQPSPAPPPAGSLGPLPTVASSATTNAAPQPAPSPPTPPVNAPLQAAGTRSATALAPTIATGPTVGQPVVSPNAASHDSAVTRTRFSIGLQWARYLGFGPGLRLEVPVYEITTTSIPMSVSIGAEVGALIKDGSCLTMVGVPIAIGPAFRAQLGRLEFGLRIALQGQIRYVEVGEPINNSSVDLLFGALLGVSMELLVGRSRRHGFIIAMDGLFVSHDQTIMLFGGYSF